jgi:CubicO group peptidase (beta-lactamase class C family)
MPAVSADLPRTRAAIERGIDEGLNTGAQLFASIGGEPAADLAIGQSRPGVPMTARTLVLWLSSTKPVVAAAVLQLVERGGLELDRPVADYLPAFAAGGKEGVTTRHLLTHTAGFRFVEVGWPNSDWEEIISRLCRSRLERGWVPGEKAGYHPFTSWYILGELVRIADGRSLPDYVRAEIFVPLGMHDCWIGMPADRYREYGDRIAILPDMEKNERPPHRYSSERGATDGIPGAGGYGPMRELAMFYEMLLGGGQRHGVRVLETETVRQMIARGRVGMFDETFKHVIDWGLGTIIDSKRYGAAAVPYGYGPHASDQAFGHSGSQSSVGFADPAHQLAVGCYLNGTPGEEKHQTRIRPLLAALYEDLGLAAG